MLNKLFIYTDVILSRIELSDNIKRLRLEKGWTQLRLAELLDTTQKTIATYQSGARKPTISKLAQIASAFGVSIDQLIGTKVIKIKEQSPTEHISRRSMRVQVLFNKLHPNDQRSLLKQIEALATHG
jgi:transcriptional regulator with XRE-family HTH domain